MTNVNRPVFNPSTGARIKYATGCPPFDAATGRPIVYGEDRSGPEWDQTTGLPINQTAQINLTTAGAPIAPAQAPSEAIFAEEGDDEGIVVVTRIADQAYEDYPAQEVTGGLTVGAIRGMFRNTLSLNDNMVALVDGVTANNSTVVNAGSNVVFKEAAKRRG